MKWLIAISILVILATFSEGGALKCTPGNEDAACASKLQGKEAPTTVAKDEGEKETTAVEAECLAGSEWESNCHYCRCSDSGVAECLKQDLCGDDIITVDPIRCKPNTTFQRDCNTCVCLENGLGLCTLDSCRRSTIVKKSDLRAGKECAPGTHWRSQCNDCGCSPEGYAFCTEKACPGQVTEPLMRCAPDTMWKNECNTCWCTSDGRAMCTRIGCLGITSLNFDNTKQDTQNKELPEANVTLSRKTRASQEVPKTCQPGQEFRMDCNKCLCDNEGQDFSCTRIDCLALNNNNNGGSRRKREATQQVTMECAPTTAFEHGCNKCRCTLDGHHAVCTMNRCPPQKDPNNLVNDINILHPIPDPEPSFRCNAGEQFKRDCNDCTCSADGKSVFCTLRLCDKDLLSPII